jgi:hypothetical protein
MTALPVPTDPVTETFCIAETLHHLEQTRRQPRLLKDFLQLDRGERRHVRRLENHRIPASERRRGFPTCDLERIVPGTDPGDHTDWFAPCVAERGRSEIQVLAGERRCHAREIFQTVGSRGHVHDAGFLDRLAGVAGFELRQLGIASTKQLRCAA